MVTKEEYEGALDKAEQARRAAQIIIQHIGSIGPENVDWAAQRAVDRIEELERQLDDLHDLYEVGKSRKEERRKMAWELFSGGVYRDVDFARKSAVLAFEVVDAFLEAETAAGEAEDLEAPVVEGDTIEAVKARIAAVQARDGGVSEAAVRCGYNRTVER